MFIGNYHLTIKLPKLPELGKLGKVAGKLFFILFFLAGCGIGKMVSKKHTFKENYLRDNSTYREQEREQDEILEQLNDFENR